MAIYNYFCTKCGDIQLEKKMSEPDYKICPFCNSSLERVNGAYFNLMFNGSYNNLNKK